MISNTPPGAPSETPQLLKMPIMGTTWSALAEAAALRLHYDQMVEIARALTPNEFCESKSVGEEGEPVRQEIYRLQTSDGVFYVKLALAEELVIAEFRKESVKEA